MMQRTVFLCTGIALVVYLAISGNSTRSQTEQFERPTEWKTPLVCAADTASSSREDGFIPYKIGEF